MQAELTDSELTAAAIDPARVDISPSHGEPRPESENAAFR